MTIQGGQGTKANAAKDEGEEQSKAAPDIFFPLARSRHILVPRARPPRCPPLSDASFCEECVL